MLSNGLFAGKTKVYLLSVSRNWNNDLSKDTITSAGPAIKKTASGESLSEFLRAKPLASRE